MSLSENRCPPSDQVQGHAFPGHARVNNIQGRNMSVNEESRHRILTTGVGSLPRRHSLSDLLLARMIGKPFDAKTLERETTEAVAEVVSKQIELGVDIISDGEQSKT